MTDRIVRPISTVSGALGVVVVAFATYVTYKSYPPRPPVGNFDDTGLAMLVIIPVTILGGLLIAHGIYRLEAPSQRSPYWLLVYPLVAAGAIGIPGVYLVYSPRYYHRGDFPELIILSLVVGGIIAGGVWVIDHARNRRTMDAV